MGRYGRIRLLGGRAALVAALALVLTISAVGAPSGALADSPGVSVTDIVTTDSGGIAVGLADGGALWVKATILASTAAGAATLFSTDELQYSDARGWFTDTPIQLPTGTLFGAYPVDVDYRLETGTVQHWSGADHGSDALFHYGRHLVVDGASFDRTETDYDHPTLTLSGTVDAFDPSTDASAPAGAGISVRVAWTSFAGNRLRTHSVTASTTSGGGFAAPVTPNGQLMDGTAVVVNPPADSAADAAVPIPDESVGQLEVRIVGTPGTTRVHAGALVTFAGTVQRLTDRGWRPLVGASVVSARGDLDQNSDVVTGQVGSGVSDRDGNYSYRVRATRTTSFFTYVRPSSYLAERSSQASQLYVPTRAKLSALTYSIDQFRTVLIRGKVHGACNAEPLALQYSANGRTGWIRIASGRTTDYYDSRPCAFSLTAVGAVDGYYRVVHAESNYLLAFDTPTRRLNRISTRITPFAMSPGRPSGSSKLVATGRITQHVGRSWTGLKVAVTLVFRPKGSTTWYRDGTGRANSTGHFTLDAKYPAKDYGDGAWAAFYNADSRHYYSQSAVRSVNVH